MSARRPSCREIVETPASPSAGAFAAKWVILSRDRELLRRTFGPDGRGLAAVARDEIHWSDDYSNLFRILK